MAAFDDVVIISGCRTAVGKFQGSLSDISAPRLGAIVVREAVKRAGIDPARVDECIMGNVVSAGLGQNPARQAAIFPGFLRIRPPHRLLGRWAHDGVTALPRRELVTAYQSSFMASSKRWIETFSNVHD